MTGVSLEEAGLEKEKARTPDRDASDVLDEMWLTKR
jgi:hypothetical protein